MIIRLPSALLLDDITRVHFVQLDGRIFSCTCDGEVHPRSPSTRFRGSRCSPRPRAGRERSDECLLDASWLH